MSQVDYKRTVSFLGRNGMFKAVGARVSGPFDVDGGEVLIEPVTSKGAIGRCYIAVPVEDLVPLANELLKLAGKEEVEN